MDHQTRRIIGGNHLLMEVREAKNLHLCLFAIMSSVFLWIILKVQHINKMFPFFILQFSQFLCPSFFSPLKVVTLCETLSVGAAPVPQISIELFGTSEPVGLRTKPGHIL